MGGDPGAAKSESTEGRIVVLDDEYRIVEVLRQHLEEEGYTVAAFTKPAEAVAYLASQSVDLLITDLRMPEIHGMEVVRQARLLDPDLAVLVLTALMDLNLAVQAMKVGAYDYLTKPFNLEEISVAVRHALERRRLILERRRHHEELERRVAEATAELRKANEELRRTKEYLESLLNSTADAIITVNPRAVITFVNRGATLMLGYTESEMVGRSIAHFLTGKVEEVRYVRRLLEESEPLRNYETELVHKDGTLIPVNMTLSFVRDSDGRIVSILAICKDITEQKRLEAELKEMSIRDSLTGLYNQRYFYDRLEAEIERARRQGHPLSLLLFDIDQFKQYNDRHGHLEGDRVLQAVGDVVRTCTREHVDSGFRYGGDEFTVILPEANEQQALEVAERIRTTFAARRFDNLTLSVGLMAYRPGSSLRGFIRFADAMMYDAKRKGGNQVYVYRDQEIREDFIEGVRPEAETPENRAGDSAKKGTSRTPSTSPPPPPVS